MAMACWQNDWLRMGIWETSISFFHWCEWPAYILKSQDSFCRWNEHFFLSLVGRKCAFFSFIVWMTSLYSEESRSFCRFFFGGGGASDLLPKWFVLSFCVNTWLYIWKLKTVFVLTVLWTGTPTTHTHNHPLHLSVSISLCFMKWI